MSSETLVTVLVFAPLVGAAIAGLFGRRIGDKPSMAITTGLLFLACAFAWVNFYNHTWGHQPKFLVELLPFIQIGDFKSTWSIRVDALSSTMMIVVTTVSALVHLYSWGYMAEDPAKPRFFAYLSLFTFAMLALVTANDFMQLFFGWEGVGLASYLLIGFWYQKASASGAAIKAFVVNRVGDFGFALGIMTVYWMFHTIRFDELFPLIPTMAGKTWAFGNWSFSALDLAGFLLFIGAMGKSAQFFLHTWLPDAMEGPTPVSALIHAATMVTAGVYMVCLLSPIYEAAPVASQIVAVIGAITALFAATVGLAQNDIKRVIAYSTCSQLGYMFFAAGIGAYQAAMFHLFTHAFFKALLFLGAGSVIHGMHHEQDMRKMGGLAKYMVLTFAMMTIGTIAITGLGFPGHGFSFGFAGFYSKDAILEAAFAAGAHSQVGKFAFFIGLFAAILTAYYSWRLVFMTFFGTPKWDHAEAHGHAHDAHADDHASAAQFESHTEPGAEHEHAVDHDHKPHESPWVMLIPLIVLSAGAIVAGFFFAPYFIGEKQVEFWGGAIFNAASNHLLHEMHEVPTWVRWAPLVGSVGGLLVAAWFYLLHEGLAKRMADRGGPLHSFFYNKWYFDELYDFVFVRGARFLGDLFWKGGDQKLIDGLGPNGFAAASLAAAKRLVRIQTGYVYHYAFVMLLGVAGLLTFVIANWHG
ncbi:NADH-quinone oxidoreductase subunit L [Caulobacter sp. 17J80-11]|uniref:NADH-quinone oxidoreductase subunit L n=1 Tax=Caulobacter sp. 17J80-11 TaxID=2763502 RepID=UPI001653EC61|nr:NADH-quinone oxidoreductase subunit L [Caulobacter sp. 17J80-11]